MFQIIRVIPRCQRDLLQVAEAMRPPRARPSRPPLHRYRPPQTTDTIRRVPAAAWVLFQEILPTKTTILVIPVVRLVVSVIELVIVVVITKSIRHESVRMEE